MSDDEVTRIPSLHEQEAARRISDAQRTGQDWLDLGDLSLGELPPELAQLTRVRHLALGQVL